MTYCIFHFTLYGAFFNQGRLWAQIRNSRGMVFSRSLTSDVKPFYLSAHDCPVIAKWSVNKCNGADWKGCFWDHFFRSFRWNRKGFLAPFSSAFYRIFDPHFMRSVTARSMLLWLPSHRWSDCPVIGGVTAQSQIYWISLRSYWTVIERNGGFSLIFWTVLNGG